MGPAAVPGDQSRSVAKGSMARCVLESIRRNFSRNQPVQDSGPPAQEHFNSRGKQAKIEIRTRSFYRRLPGSPRLCAPGGCAAHRQTAGQPTAESQSEPQAQLCQHQASRWVRVAATCFTFPYQTPRAWSRKPCDPFYCMSPCGLL